MNSGDKLEKWARAFLGTLFHVVFCLFCGFFLSILIGAVIGIVSRQAAKNTELVTLVLSGAFFGWFAAPRWFRWSAPWVGVFGLWALFSGVRELSRTWSPTWSDQTRHDYLMSQLFGISPGCGTSECLNTLFYGYPFLLLTAYGIASAVALAVTQKNKATA
jgi:phosphotransferase system  glucose/maltose/N-acetylglucosamine-specific IIC component